MERVSRQPEVIFMGPLKPFHFDPEKKEFTADEPAKSHKIKLSEIRDILRFPGCPRVIFRLKIPSRMIRK